MSDQTAVNVIVVVVITINSVVVVLSFQVTLRLCYALFTPVVRRSNKLFSGFLSIHADSCSRVSLQVSLSTISITF